MHAMPRSGVIRIWTCARCVLYGSAAWHLFSIHYGVLCLGPMHVARCFVTDKVLVVVLHGTCMEERVFVETNQQCI